MVISVALDRSAEAARPWIEAARPTHPSLIDTRHVLADLYNIVNVPTAVWIDEAGRIVRPNDVAFGTDTFRHITSIDSAKHTDALRAWVRGTAPALSADRVQALQSRPQPEDQLARAEFGLAQWLADAGRAEAAERHFVRAGELAPHDFTIRRGSMPIRGIDPMGPDFRAMVQAWAAAGNAYYRPLPE
ncbi:MAG: thioredoxin family protein [Candidatus Rokubacteria bacterium]|nr:thioredoxin family protein [Candidatus Rokubacteria bacterium]